MLVVLLFWLGGARAQNFKRREAEIARSKQWLDSVGASGLKVWTRIDSSRRPHKIYVGQAFYKLTQRKKREFVETFSHYLAGHPKKFAIVDIFDARTKSHIGEFGWGGFKFY